MSEAPVTLTMMVPTFNTERYLGEALTSLGSVRLPQLEVLLVNDGSTDGSLALMHEAAARDGRFRVIDKPNEGYGASVNRGIDEARGTYVGILEPDDFLYDGALERLVAVALQTGADVVKGDFTFYWSRDGGVDEPAGIVSADMVGHAVNPREDPRIFRAKASIWSGIYRRAFLNAEAIRCLPTPGASFQDTSFSFKAFAAAHEVRFVDAPVVHYRQDNEASSINSSGKAYAVCGEFDEIDRYVEGLEGSPSQGILRLEAQIGRLNAYLWNLDRLGEGLDQEFANYVARQYREWERTGAVDLAAWDGWRALNVRALEADPERYLRLRKRYRGDSAGAKARFALSLGGPKALAAALAERAGRR